VGEQFLVAEALSFESSAPAIVVHGDGSFTGAIESFEDDGSGFGVFLQRYTAEGSPLLLTPVQVNTHTAGDQAAPAIAGDADGNVLVVWESKDQDGDGYGIFGQWYDDTGAALGDEFQVNTTTAGDQRAPAAAMDALGNTVVAWQSEGQDGDSWGVYYTRFSSVGDTTGTELPANVATLGEQQAPTVAAAANGNFVIAWEAIDPAGGDDASLDIYAQVFDSLGDTIADEFRVNTEMLRDQVTPQAAMDADGDFVIVWVGGGIPGSGSDVFGQRFNELGAAQGLEFRVNNTTMASQVNGVVAMDADGNFLVAWQSVHQDGFSEGIVGREYDANGGTLVDEFIVNTQVEDPQSLPSVAMNAGGQAVVTWRGKNETHEPAVFAQRFLVPNVEPDFVVGTELVLGSFVELEENKPAAAMDIAGNTVVVWESYDQDGSGLGVFGQRLDTLGEPVGDAFLVNSDFTTGNQSAPAVARAADGRFVVVWQSDIQDGDGGGIYAQLYDVAGLPVGSAFLVNTTVAGDQSSPAVAMAEDGSFVVVWQSVTDDETTDILAQRYDAAGNPLDGEFQVNQFTALDQVSPAVAMNALGQFVIAWVSSHPAETAPELDAEKSIFVQWYDAAGVASGDEVLAHNHVAEAQESPAVGIDAAGNFVVAWQSINQDGSTWGVYARQFLADKTPVQADEFLVNETTEGLQRLVGIGVQADGHFVIAWESTSSDQQDGSSTDVYRREYLPDGTPDGSENLVNNWLEGPQVLPVVARATTGNYGIFWLGQGFSHVDGVHGRLYDVNLSGDPGEPSRVPVGDQFFIAESFGFESNAPAIAVHGDGTFTVAFETFDEDGSGFGIFVERFNADGTPIDGSRVQVNAGTEGDQSAPAIAGDAAGNVLIVWQSKEEDGEGYGVFGQWFDSTGAALGTQFLVNSATAGDQQAPTVAMDDAGRAVVAWQSAGQDGEGWGIYYKRYDSIGDTTGIETMAHEEFVGDQQAPTVAAAATSGSFLIAWQGPGAAEEEEEASVEIFARLFDVAAVPQGTEFQVNTESLHDQVAPAAAMDSAGNAIVVWQAEGQQGSGSDVFGQLLNSSGGHVGSEFRVNDTTSGGQRGPAVSTDADGNFLITWQSIHQDGFSWGIFGREYDASGNTLEDEFQINTRVQGPQTSPGVDTNAAGETVVAWLGNDATHTPAVFGQRYLLPNTTPDLKVGPELVLSNFQGLEETPPAAAMNAVREAVVVWESYAEDGSGLGIFAQMLDAVGNPIGDRFAVNTVTPGNQSAPAVARTPDGGFVIAWQSEAEDGDGYGIFARRYSASGVPDGPVFQVNTTNLGDQTAPAVAMTPDGRFTIVWQSLSGDGSLDIHAQHYLADGQADGEEFRVNNFTGLDQKDPAIAMNSAGQFVIAWVSDHPALTDPDDTEKSIFVQWFDSNGQSTGDEFLVHRFVKDAQEAPAVGIDYAGRFVVAWQSINQDGNTWGVFARRFEADKTPSEHREFVVNETRQGPQRYVGVGVDEVGRLVITWQSNSHTQEGSSWDLFSRQYGKLGENEGGELPVNQWTMGPQIHPVVAQAPGGDFGIFWLGQGPEHVEGVHGRLYETIANLPFMDDFNRTDSTLLAGPWIEQVGNVRIDDLGVELEWNTEAVYTLRSVEEADVSVSVDYDLTGAESSRSIGVLARYAGPGDANAYMARVFVSNGSIAAQIWKNIDGVYTPLRSVGIGTTSTASTGRLRFDVIGAELHLFVDENLVTSAVDYSIAGPGSVGVRQTGGIVDNFSAEIGVPPLVTEVVLPFSDNFQRPDGSLLGPEWTERAGDVSIVSGQVTLEAQETSVVTLNGPIETDVVIEADIDVTSLGSFGNVGLLARHTGVGDGNAYMARLYRNGAGLFFVQVWRHTGGDWEFLAHSQVVSGVGRLRFEVVGTSLKAYFNDVLAVDVSDNLIAGPGLIGFRHSGGLMDNFAARLPV